MPTIILNTKEDFIRKCKEFGIFNAYISIEDYEQKVEEQSKITTIARLTALSPTFGSALLLANITYLDKIADPDAVMAFIKDIQDKAGDKLVFCYGVATM